MSSDEVLKALQSMEFTRDIEPKSLEKLVSMAFTATFAEGEVIFREGEVGDVIYLIQEGRAAVETHIPGRGRVTIFTVGPGQLLGWSALFPGKRKTSSGRALVKTKAIAISAPQLRGTCHSDNELGCLMGWRIAETISDRLKATRLQLMDIFAPSGA